MLICFERGGINKLMKLENNYAFIDSSNLYLGVKDLGWSLDFKKFRIYLKEKYKVEKAYLFIGNVPENGNLYKDLQEDGYVLILKPTIPNEEGELKGNVDADLVLQAMVDYDVYNKAVIVSGDGDFYSLVHHLYKNNKLLRVIAPNMQSSSQLIRGESKGLFMSLDNSKKKLEYLSKRKGTT